MYGLCPLEKPRSVQLGGLDVPVLLRVVEDGSVRAELAHLRAGPDGFLDPLRAILVGLVNHSLGVDV